MIIDFVNQKGGTGKSTIAFKVAHIMKKQGVKVCLLDLDKQQTCRRNRERGFGEFDVFSPGIDGKNKNFEISQESVSELINDKKDKYDIILMDMAGAFDEVTISALQQVDLAIVPFQVSPNDIPTTVTFVKYLEKIEEIRERPFKKIALLPNRIKSGSNDLKNLMQFKPILEIKEKHYMFESYITDLQIHKNYTSNLDTVTEDFGNFVRELIKLIKS